MNSVDKKDFAKKIFLGGLVILLPVALLVMGFRWLFRLVTDLIQPLTDLVTKTIGMPEIFADILVLGGMVALCFCVGWLVSTAGGAWFHSKFDGRLSRYAPGYQIIKDIVGQFFGDASKSPFANGEVAMVRLFGADCTTEVTAIVTSKHDDGRYTVFVATGPNPTSGNIYHVRAEQVTLYPSITVSDAMRTIIACGAGTGDLLSDTSAVGSHVRTSEQKGVASTIELNVSKKCKAFLKANGLMEAQKLVAASYRNVSLLRGFEEGFVEEIIEAISGPEYISAIGNSDWAPLSLLGLGPKITNTLKSEGYHCVYELENEKDDVLKKISGLGPKTIVRIKECIKAFRQD